MNCPHTLIEPALDRWAECHWHLHQMEASYHQPETWAAAGCVDTDLSFLSLFGGYWTHLVYEPALP